MSKFFSVLLTLISVSALALSLWMFSSFKAPSQVSSPVAQDSGLKIGVIDMNKALASSSQFKNGAKDIEKQFEKRAKDIEAAQKKFQKDIEAFSKNSPTMKADAQKIEQQKIIDQQKKLQEMQVSLQKDANEAHNKMVNGVLEQIKTILDKIADEKKLDLIVAKAATAYNKKEFEITDEVIAKLKK